MWDPVPMLLEGNEIGIVDRSDATVQHVGLTMTGVGRH